MFARERCKNDRKWSLEQRSYAIIKEVYPLGLRNYAANDVGTFWRERYA